MLNKIDWDKLGISFCLSIILCVSLVLIVAGVILTNGWALLVLIPTFIIYYFYDWIDEKCS